MKLSIRPSVLLSEIWNTLLILLFGYTAFSKLYEHLIFYQQLEKLPVVGSIARVLSWVLPLVELGTAVLLISPKTRLRGNQSAALLLFCFTLYLLLIYISQADMPCACGGFIENLTWAQHLLFNLFFFLLTIPGIYRYKKLGTNSAQIVAQQQEKPKT